MKTVVRATTVVATILVGMWATMVLTWMRHFEPADFHE